MIPQPVAPIKEVLQFTPSLALFKCPCGKALNTEKEIQQHAQCKIFRSTYGGLLQEFIKLKQNSQQPRPGLESYQARLNLHTLLSSFGRDMHD